MNATVNSEALDKAISIYHPLLREFLTRDRFNPLILSPERSKHQANWRSLFESLTQHPPSSTCLAERFHTKWHVCHHFLRELVDDDNLLIEMLWVWLPRYKGDGLVLYRGENIDRLDSGRIGTAWSDKEATAEMFASGWNREGKGSVILRANVAAEAIIAGPSNHSAKWLGESEFTVDTRNLETIEQVCRYAPKR